MKYILIFLLIPVFCFSQKQANTWYFGNGAGIKFTNGVPSGISGGQTYLQNGHAEGTAVMSDGKGDLLFYTNGETIWNRFHVPMGFGTGLMGSYSAAQSSLILPLPGSTRLFYVFTLDDYNNNLQNGFRYSVVDMCLEVEYGLVVQNQKNILIANSMGEQLTAVRHANGKDYWLIVHKFFSNSFHAYLFSSTGIFSSPVITSIGSIHTSTAPFPASALGTMKASPDGSRIGIVTGNGGHIREIFNFDNNTGVLSNFLDLHTAADINQDAYSCSFSPDNTKFYLTFNAKVWQYDLTAGGGSPSAIQNSKILINGNSTGNNSALQLGPDNKLYVGEYGAPYLSVINSPNLAGLACNYTQNAVDLLGNNCNYGLPNFVDSFSYSNKSVECTSDISEIKSLNEHNVYPNPCKDVLTFQVCSDSVALCTIYDELSNVLSKNYFTNSITISTSQFSNGIYSYIISINNSIIHSGFVVKEK